MIRNRNHTERYMGHCQVVNTDPLAFELSHTQLSTHVITSYNDMPKEEETFSNSPQTRSDNHNITKPAVALKKPLKITSQ